MVKQRVFNHHKYDRAVICPTKASATKHVKDLKENIGKTRVSARIVKTKRNYFGKQEGYEIYYRLK
jgi:hypothetical protein